MPDTRKTVKPGKTGTAQAGVTPSRQHTGEATPPGTPIKINLRDQQPTMSELELKFDNMITLQNTMAKDIEDLKSTCKRQRIELGIKDELILRLDHKIEELDGYANSVDDRLCDLEDGTKECNLKIDGRDEVKDEDVIKTVMDLAMEMGTEIMRDEIEAAFRMGKPNATHTRPRTIMIKYKSKSARNKMFYNRSKLANISSKQTNGRVNKIWLNDDIGVQTARRRDDLRVIAELCKTKGNEGVRVHSDGLIINNKKTRINDLDQLPEEYSLNKARTLTRDGHTHYSSRHSPLSNLYTCNLTVKGQHFSSVEQAYQFRKATELKQKSTAQAILKERDPYVQKRLGDTIPTTKAWDDTKVLILEEICRVKFNENENLKQQLLQTEDNKLCEATRDQFWGTGCKVTTPHAKDNTWRGQNESGKILERIRLSLR